MLAIRGPFSMLGGALLAAALFFVLARLVSVPFEIPPFVPVHDIDFRLRIKPTTPQTTRAPMIEREPPIVDPVPPRIDIGDGDGVIERVAITRPTVDTGPRSRGIGLSGIDTDVIPRVRVNPDYPPQAVIRNIEGWVQVRFTVTATGAVRDAQVVGSEPGTVFDEAALKAIARWRYNPRVEDGEAVERVGLQTIIRFELQN